MVVPWTLEDYKSFRTMKTVTKFVKLLKSVCVYYGADNPYTLQHTQEFFFLGGGLEGYILNGMVEF